MKRILRFVFCVEIIAAVRLAALGDWWAACAAARVKRVRESFPRSDHS